MRKDDVDYRCIVAFTENGTLKWKTITRWYHYLAYFFGGAFLANALPHLGNGISGHAFQSPFATPPGVGLSSSTVNVLWGLFNLAVGYLLVCRVGNFELRKTRHVLVLGAGILVFSVLLARAIRPVPRGAVSLCHMVCFQRSRLDKTKGCLKLQMRETVFSL